MSLTNIARQMKSFALAHPRPGLLSIDHYQYTLTGGLTLTCTYHTGRSEWRLSLTRKGTPPSPTEVQVCKRRFEIPDLCREERSIISIANTGAYHVIRLTWPAEPKQLDLIPDEQ